MFKWETKVINYLRAVSSLVCDGAQQSPYYYGEESCVKSYPPGLSTLKWMKQMNTMDGGGALIADAQP